MNRLTGFFATGAAALPVEGELPPLGGATGWLNSPPLTAAELRGNVVVINFCTYTCINWLRQLPYVRAWAERYKDHGLVTIGAHTPEFSFEHDVDNVRRALQEGHLEYPIAIDSDYTIWQAFDNAYWPALYFVDAEGHIRHHHFGEGAYEESEMVIQRLLTEAGQSGVGHDLVSVNASGIEAAADWGSLKSPENYVGYERTENFASPGGVVPNERQVYSAPDQLRLNHWACPVNGRWGERRRAWTKPTARSSTASTHVISISSWDLQRRESPRAFGCSSTGSHRKRRTAATSTSKATAQSASSGSIS